MLTHSFIKTAANPVLIFGRVSGTIEKAGKFHLPFTREKLQKSEER